MLIADVVVELLSDEQLASVEAQARSGRAACVYCGATVDPELSDAAVVMLVDEARRRAAVRIAHPGCGDSDVLAADLGGAPAEARLAERWAAFVLPRVPVIVLEARAAVWADESGPALLQMLRGLGFEGARELFDSDLFATGVGAPPIARGLMAEIVDHDAVLTLAGGTVLETLPGAMDGGLAKLTAERGGLAVVIGTELGLPDPAAPEPLSFERLLPVLFDRAVGALVPLSEAGAGGTDPNPPSAA